MSDQAYNLMAMLGGASMMYGWWLSRRFYWPVYVPMVTVGAILFLLSIYQPFGLISFP